MDGDWWYQEVDDEDPPPAKIPHAGDPIDPDFGTPYTGGGVGGAHPDPNEPVGGLDRESGKVFPVIPTGGGGQEIAGRTPDDKDGEDDSAHFLGDPNLVPHDNYIPPPDGDIPYHKMDDISATEGRKENPDQSSDSLKR